MTGPGPAAGLNALDQFAATLDALDAHLTAAGTAMRRSEHNRLSLLHLHAAAAAVVAPLFASIGQAGMQGPSWTIIRHIPAAPYSLAVLLGVGGVILGVATWFRHRSAEMVGLGLLLAWYVIIAGSFGGAVLLWLADGSPPGPRPPAYPAGVYAHLAVIMAVHLRTLWRMRRPR
ncbi:hypothetical protein ABZ671_00925 [Micromonospora sp. NPDC006766]|uniref:hypothetical protein n=1 Tax=Micromonospora sp. NPDC006766 TaxID=3154778 RepID=UPI0033FC78F9